MAETTDNETEERRLAEASAGGAPWRLWGPYVSERQWGTVREDYSADGTAWEYVSHDDARSRAYRWGEDGIGGLSDDRQLLCFAPAVWNGRDPIIKERLFGLSGNEGNHGEDVKEYYYHLDSTPTHSYMKMLYKYPHVGFPYTRLVEENQNRGREQGEFELVDTGAFDQDRYWDLFVEYAKAAPDDILIRLTAINRSSEESSLHLLGQLWFRNTWAWDQESRKPSLHGREDFIEAQHEALGSYRFEADGDPARLFCENETNVDRLFGTEGKGPYKDGINDYLVHGDEQALSRKPEGTKAAVYYRLTVGGGKSATVKLRLSAADGGSKATARGFADFDELFEKRRAEADAYYDRLQADMADEEERRIQRQAIAGLLWSKQYYCYDVARWLAGDPAQPAPPQERLGGRNHNWTHLNNADIISMPDTWEYPWYAAWDLAFHTVALSLVDLEFAKHQLILLTHEWYMHPNGQLPAYEWAFEDVNPPVHAWAAWRVFQIDRKQNGGAGDIAFLQRVFHKLLLNFTWWVNRKDPGDRNVFEGGFLGLDNIGVFDRSSPLPTGGYINQADATSWMAMYSLNLMRIALELAQHNHVYEDIATKFFEHFLYIAKSMSNMGSRGLSLWDEADGFYYDVLSLPGDKMVPMKLKSMVGLIPLFAVETLEPELLEKVPTFRSRMQWFLDHRPDLSSLVSRWHEPGHGDRRLLSLLRGHRMKALLRKMLDESEFLSDYGVRSLSKQYERRPYRFDYDSAEWQVTYEPGESQSGTFGGNSNWRGPIWFPVNYLIIESLQKFHHYYGDDFKIECPTGSGSYVTILEASEELTRRLSRLFRDDADGAGRPADAYYARLKNDPHFRPYLTFFEYFHGDTGRGLGASHQTGWTALIAKLLKPRR